MKRGVSVASREYLAAISRGAPEHIGFTGTQNGMKPLQAGMVAKQLLRLRVTGAIVLHHGDCIGADDQAQALALLACGLQTEAHPGDNPAKRAYTSGNRCVHPPKGMMTRNDDIIEVSGWLVAAPEGDEADFPRSGTWATIRRARKKGIVVTICWPDGSSFEEIPESQSGDFLPFGTFE